MATTSLQFTPQRSAAPIEGGVLDLLIRLQAPDAPAAEPQCERPTLRLAIVIDRSGSMDGEPLAQALRCAQHLIARLQATDEVAVVLYDDTVSVPIPMQPVARTGLAAKRLDEVISGGSTALHAGWVEGLRQLGEGRPGAINRVVLLSDGQANIGPQSLADFEPEVRSALARGLSTTTVGLGRGFNEDLMLGLARLGGGQSYYGQTAADLADAFDEEFALLQALCARQLKVHLSLAAGVQLELLSDVRADLQAGWIALPDLAHGAESWVLLRLHLAAAEPSEVDRRPLLSARVTGTAVAAASVDSTVRRLALPGLPAGMVDRLPEEPMVVERRAEVMFGRALLAVHAALRSKSEAALTQAVQTAEAAALHQPWLTAKLEALTALVEQDRDMAMKEARFSANRLEGRLTARDGGPTFSADEMTVETRPWFLRRKVVEGRGA